MKIKFRKKRRKVGEMCGIPLPPADSFKPCVFNLQFDRGFPTYSNIQTELAAAHVRSCVRACGVYINKSIWFSTFSPK